MKKLFLGIVVMCLFLMVACESDGSGIESIEPIIDAKAYALMSKEDVEAKHGELNDSGPLDNFHVYSTQDGKFDFIFDKEGGLQEIYLYRSDNPVDVENPHDIPALLGVEEGENVTQTQGVARYQNIDKDGLIKEVYFMGDNQEPPMKATMIQVFYDSMGIYNYKLNNK